MQTTPLAAVREALSFLNFKFNLKQDGVAPARRRGQLLLATCPLVFSRKGWRCL
jgi:hypothetical protein